MAAPLSVPELRRAKFARRLPGEPAALVGPDHGAVSLPLHLAWSGLTELNLDQPRLRMSYYRIVLAEGLHDELGRRHARDAFDLTDLQARLAGADWIDDSEFAAYGLDDQAITELRRWAQAWADDIAERLIETDVAHDD